MKWENSRLKNKKMLHNATVFKVKSRKRFLSLEKKRINFKTALDLFFLYQKSRFFVLLHFIFTCLGPRVNAVFVHKTIFLQAFKSKIKCKNAKYDDYHTAERRLFLDITRLLDIWQSLERHSPNHHHLSTVNQTQFFFSPTNDLLNPPWEYLVPPSNCK